MAVLLASPAFVSASPLEIRSVRLTGLADAILFETLFDRAPDFYTVDQYDRNYDAFQLTLTHNVENPFQFRDVWVQGIDIHTGFIPVLPMQPNGYFGPMSAYVPYVMSQTSGGHLMSFSIPHSALNAPNSVIPPSGIAGPGTGAFHWFMDTYQYGQSEQDNNHAQGRYQQVPEPTTLIQMALGLGVGFLSLRKRRQRRAAPRVA
jgi:hypothetical protein